jgi:3-phosphoshikimate 1-carboxyvinyltransferase
MLGALAEGETLIQGFLESEDCLATLVALRAMGAEIEQRPNAEVRIQGRGGMLQAPSQALDMGNSGTAMRLMMGVLATQSFNSTLIGDSSLMRRPMERVAVPLRLMGATVKTLEGRPPVQILATRGLRAIDYPLPVASAQVKSAILLAALGAQGRTRVHEPGVSRDHTERMFATFGVEVLRQGNTLALEGGQTLRGTEVQVPGDFSSAAFFLVAASIARQGGLMLRNVGVNPTRAGLLELLQRMGANIRVLPRGGGKVEPSADIEIQPATLRGIQVPAELVSIAIDEFPIFFIAAACARGASVLRGAEELRVKESDRLAVMAEGLQRLGVAHELSRDGIWIAGAGDAADAGDVFGGGEIDSHGDHRVAMAFAVASLRARAPLLVRDVANVATSFPGFAALANGLGLDIEVASTP